MTVKFRIGLTITGETLFGIMAKMLPIEDLSVEELAPESRVVPTPQIAKPRRRAPPRIGPGPNLTKGVNGVIMRALADGPKRPSQIEPQAKAVGLSPKSVASRLEFLRKHKIIEPVGDGTWRLK